MEPFETERLIVRQFRQTMEDADDLFAFNSAAEVMRYIRPIKTREESDAFLEETIHLYLEGFPYGRMHVSEKSSGRFIGSFSILYLDQEADYHIGYALMPEYWGKGLATELLQQGIAVFFERTAHPHLFAITHPENETSVKLLLKNGFSRDGIFLMKDQALQKFRISRPEMLDI